MFRRLLQGASRFKCQAIAFDAATDYGTRGAELTGVADGKTGTTSFWADLDADGSAYIIFANSPAQGEHFRIEKPVTNKWEILGYDGVPALKLNIITGAVALAAARTRREYSLR